jgi:RNA polymerase sigma-70 factor (ECF subfamily)
MSYEEIAQVTTVNLGTVKSRLSRARSKMRDYLREHQELLPANYRL